MKLRNLKFVEIEDGKLRKRYSSFCSQEEVILARTEVGRGFQKALRRF